MNQFLREASWRFVIEQIEYDQTQSNKKTRDQLSKALVQYWEQEISDYMIKFIQSNDGQQILDAVARRYNKPQPRKAVRYGASGIYK